ncbi:mCG142752, isoform CRA_a [Mus musculus]|jgi:hypothetical protein|nr:mCG142752, isoform CRA_a [Mus musculus]
MTAKQILEVIQKEGLKETRLVAIFKSSFCVLALVTSPSGARSISIVNTIVDGELTTPKFSDACKTLCDLSFLLSCC